MNTETPSKSTAPTFLNTDQLLDHWLGHKRLTRKMIQAFPDDKLFTYSVAGMRPFSELVMEFLHMTIPGVKGLATSKWERFEGLPGHEKGYKPTTKQQLLELWDEATKQLEELWPTIPSHRFTEKDTAFGQWEGTGYYFILYFIENEVHHRGQAYVYLRSLGIEPPGFYDRG